MKSGQKPIKLATRPGNSRRGTVELARFFKRSSDGQWHKKTSRGKYAKLTSSRETKRLLSAIPKMSRLLE